MVPPAKRNPMKTTSRGVGELIAHAVNRGARQIILGVGGSATVDGGIGALKALGIRFLNHQGREVSEGGQGLLSIAKIDSQKCVLACKGIEITILADVQNPLLGSTGAARVFGPQKGATPKMVFQLEIGLKHLKQAIVRLNGRSMANVRSTGAAGGVVAGFLGVLGSIPGVKVKVVRGIDYVLNALNVVSSMKKADWIFTGEGQLDFQTAHGKTIEGVTRFAKKMNKPVIALAGKVHLNSKQMKSLGLRSAFSIAPGPCSLEESFQNSAEWLEATTARVVRLIAG
jgi:glycerate kinase